MILVLNAGSSSLKFGLFGDHPEEASLWHGRVELGEPGRLVLDHPVTGARSEQRLHGRIGHAAAVELLLSRLASEGLEPRAVGHRVVHGGTRFDAPVRVDDSVLEALSELESLAPLHQPHNLAPIRALRARDPGLPQVACFDTAFHRSQSELEQRYALPDRITSQGVRRYGFHGLSYESIASRLPGVDVRAAAGRCVVLHLGAGASMCALRAGCSVATTMGFTALEGLPMGTRSGSLDPGVVLHLMRVQGLSPAQVEHLLYHESGLLGVSDVSADVRVLEASSAPGAALALELLCHRIARELGSLAAAIEGLDALVFTAGIGENSARVRAEVCRRATWLGVELDSQANGRHGPCISAPGSAVKVWVLPTDEEGTIARHVRAVVAT